MSEGLQQLEENGKRSSTTVWQTSTVTVYIAAVITVDQLADQLDTLQS